MTPAEAIAMLDKQIAEHGQTVKLKRGTTGPHETQAFVRGFKASEIAGLLQQGDRQVVVSPSGLGSFGVPEAQDKISIAGSAATVQSVESVRIGDVLVRLNLVVRG
ncbi:hypothetical protein [Devosia aurantiaca]|uniref:Uncharacterized protein n=1 Tax=Devosia aurantiaca TaxID=2714858 RepID=A0A6M1SNZ0_9HYPH|nr:hypothetical protein [Devosia aurantiaca]NGP18918.1 hypothetical protein [Devosia aurantiaca]